MFHDIAQDTPPRVRRFGGVPYADGSPPWGTVAANAAPTPLKIHAAPASRFLSVLTTMESVRRSFRATRYMAELHQFKSP